MTTPTYVGDNGPDGVILGSSATVKAGMHGAAVVQASAITAVTTTASTSTSPVGFSTTTQADAIVTAVNSIITALKNKGITA